MDIWEGLRVCGLHSCWPYHPAAGFHMPSWLLQMSFLEAEAPMLILYSLH